MSKTVPMRTPITSVPASVMRFWILARSSADAAASSAARTPSAVSAGSSGTGFGELRAGVGELGERRVAGLRGDARDEVGEHAHVPAVLDGVERRGPHAVVGRDAGDVDVDDAVLVEQLRRR